MACCPVSTRCRCRSWAAIPSSRGRPARTASRRDRTARAGDRYDTGVRLLERLVAAVPGRHTAPTDPTPPNSNEGPGLRYHQAQFADRVNGTEVWEYMAIAAVAQGDGTGRVLAEVHTPGNTLPTETCELARAFWGMDGDCQVVTVGTTLAGVATRQPGAIRGSTSGPRSGTRMVSWSSSPSPCGSTMRDPPWPRCPSPPSSSPPSPPTSNSTSPKSILARRWSVISARLRPPCRRRTRRRGRAEVKT